MHNVRATGGAPLRGGGSTRPDVLYRSDALSSVTPAGVEELAASPIGVIVDFRTEQERHSAPDVHPDSRP
ncbi:tyrosine-protein phosphatase [Microbacterium lacticum]